MSDLQELYQQVILDHNRAPRNFKKIENANYSSEGFNPLCGDRYTIYVQMEDDLIREIGFQGSGCAISKASASLMTESVKGKTKAEAFQLFESMHRMLISTPGSPVDSDKLGKLAVFSGVREFPVRVKCASLAWHTLQAAIQGVAETVTTE